MDSITQIQVLDVYFNILRQITWQTADLDRSHIV